MPKMPHIERGRLLRLLYRVPRLGQSVEGQPEERLAAGGADALERDGAALERVHFRRGAGDDGLAAAFAEERAVVAPDVELGPEPGEERRLRERDREPAGRRVVGEAEPGGV